MKNYNADVSPGGELRAHVKYANNSKDAIVEIGVLNGQTTRILLENSTCEVYGIDPIIPDSMNSSLIGNINLINNLSLEFKERFTFIKDYSFNVVKNWDKKIDYIFIDGDHLYEAVKIDFEDWYPFVKNGGIVAFHDSSANRGGPDYWPGPSKLADELLNDERLDYIETIGTMTIFKKI